MSEPERHLPQLVMWRELVDLPELEPPPPYRVRSFEPGDEAGWIDVIEASFGTPLGPEGFRRRMVSDGQFRPQRVWFAVGEGGPVATASAWWVPRWREAIGVLHMVGVHPRHLGHRLGYQVSLAALHQLAREGRRVVVLQTDDFRVPAVRTYLRLGFAPLVIHENQRARWRAVLPRAGEDEVEARFGPALAAELVDLEQGNWPA